MHHLCGLSASVSGVGVGTIIDVISSITNGAHSTSYDHVVMVMFDDGTSNLYHTKSIKLNPNEVITKLFLAAPKIARPKEEDKND